MAECPFLDKELKEKTISIINNYIKEKEIILIQRREEHANLPDRYIVKDTVKKEIDELARQIDLMKKTVSEIECGSR